MRWIGVLISTIVTNVAWAQLLPPPAAWVAPGHLFKVTVPPSWNIALHDNDPQTIDFRSTDRDVEGTLQVRRITVPSGAKAKQLMLQAIDSRLKKLPMFKVKAQREVMISGLKAAAVTGTYRYQGNVQFPRAIEEIYVVAGDEGFVFHFECFEPAVDAFAEDLNTFYSSFQPRPPGESAGKAPGKNQDPTTMDPLSIPF